MHGDRSALMMIPCALAGERLASGSAEEDAEALGAALEAKGWDTKHLFLEERSARVAITER